MFVLGLQMSGKHLAVPFVHLLDGSDPFVLAVNFVSREKPSRSARFR
jgi:hypothetical protein